MLTITLYSKSGCHLCEDIKAELANLQDAYPHYLVEVDITEDKALFDRYRYTIPVVQIGQKELQAPVSTAQLIAVLKEAESGESHI